MNTKNTALFSGIFLLLMTALAIYAEMGVRQRLIIPGDAVRSVQNIRTNIDLFRNGMIAFTMVGVLDILVAITLYYLFASAQRTMMLLSALIRIAYAVVLFMAIGYWNRALQSAGTNADPSAVMAQMDAFSALWKSGLSLFGIHLILLGFVMDRSFFAPGWLGWMMVITGGSYALDAVLRVVMPEWTIEFAAFVGWGEIVLMVWLFWKSRMLSNGQLNAE